MRPRLRLAFALALAAVSLAPPASAADVTADARPQVRIATGVVTGVAHAGVASYLGMPYAAPPVGALRWRAPAPAAAWSAPRDASQYGASCIQARPLRAVADGSPAATTSEDCLLLNVRTAAPAGAKRPVMLWIHGGGNDSGTGSQTYYDGTAFARDGVVLVTANYRLGALGFFAHPALTAAAGDEPLANFGLMDQIAALRWIRANAAAFGGDPANVTIFGESAGGEDALALTTLPQARGLFARAIVESAGFLWEPWPSLSRARARGAHLASANGLPGARATAEQLRALPASAFAHVDDDDDLGPIVDGRLVTAPLMAALAKGTGVPLVIGTNADDGSVIGSGGDPAPILQRLPAADREPVRANEVARGAATDAELAQFLVTDAEFAAPARRIAEVDAAAGVPVYRYRFDYVESILQRKAATHGSEIPFVFESWAAPDLIDADDRSVGAALHACWIAFATNGAPACAGIAAWPRYDPADPRELVVDAHPSLRDPGDTFALDRFARTLSAPAP